MLDVVPGYNYKYRHFYVVSGDSYDQIVKPKHCVGVRFEQALLDIVGVCIGHYYNGKKQVVLYTSGVLSTIKRRAKKRYKYEIRRLKHRKHYLLWDRLAPSFAMKKKASFWSDVNRLNKKGATEHSPVVDGVSGTKI